MRKEMGSRVQSGKNEKRDRLVLKYLPLAKAIAIRVHERLPLQVELDDLVHAGVLGLFDAATKYDPDKKVKFPSYAQYRIKGAILDSLRQTDWASRDLRKLHKQVETATHDLTARLQRAPTEGEMAEHVGVDVERWRQICLDLRRVLVSASTDHEEPDQPDFPSKPDTQPENIFARWEIRSILNTTMRTLPERYHNVVLLYYTRDMTMKEIGGVLGINESRVSQIHKSAMAKMQMVLKSNGIQSSRAF